MVCSMHVASFYMLFPYGQSLADDLFQNPHKINHFENDAVSS